jgi:cytochrome oxidase assembly protein ShyY1
VRRPGTAPATIGDNAVLGDNAAIGDNGEVLPLIRRLAFLFRPGWVALGVTVIAFTYLCFSVLAPWQLGKNTRISRENGQIRQSLTAPPVPLTTLLPQQNSSAPEAQWRRVTATGHYLSDKQLLVRLRTAGGEPALEVLTPFVTDGGPTVLIDRGYVRPQQNSPVPPIPPPPGGTVTVTARLRDSEPPVPGKAPFTSGGVLQVYSIDTGRIPALTGVPLAGSYLQLADGQPGGLGVVEVPHLDAGPFLSYGIQWIAFGILAPVLLGYFVYTEIRVRRAHGHGTATDAAPVTPGEKLADRYGRRR